MSGEGGDADTAAGPQLSGCADPRSATAPSPGTSAAPSLAPAFAAASGRCQPALIAPGLGRMPQAAVGQAVTPNTAAQPQPAAPPLSELNSGLAACEAAGTAAAAQPAIATQTVPAVPSEHAATMQWLAAAVAAAAQGPAAPAVPVPVPVQRQQQQQQQQQAADTLARALPGAAADGHAAAQPAAPLQAATLQEAVAAASRVPLSVARSAAARRGPTPALLTAQNRASGTGRGVSLYNGVCFDRRKQRWFSQIQQAGKRHFLGYHPSEEEAAQAYDRAALQLYGSQAQLNFPLDAVQSPASHNTTAGTGLHGSSTGTGSLPVGHTRQHIQPVVGAATTAEAAASQQPNMAAALLAALLGVPATIPVAQPQPPPQPPPQPQPPFQQARPQAVRQASPQRPVSPLSALQQLATLQQLQLLEQQLNPQREQQQEEVEEQKQQQQQQQPPLLPQQSAQQKSSPQPQQPGPSSPSLLPGSDAGPGRLGSQIGRKRHHSELESEAAERQAP